MENKYDKIFIVGTGKLVENCSGIIIKNGYKPVVLEYGDTSISVLNRYCDKNEITYQRVSKQELTTILYEEKEETLIISADNIYLFPEKVVNNPHLTIINWHNALLPKHKGRNAEAWAIFSEDEVSGITWHYIDPQIDSGQIIAQQAIKITETETSLGLFAKQVEIGTKVFEEIIVSVLNGSVQSKEQDDIEITQMHYSKDRPNNSSLDLGWDYSKISAFLRAYDYGPLRLLGNAFIELETNEQYIWRRYKLFPDKRGNDLVKYDVEKNKLIIQKENGTVELIKCKQV